MYCLFYDREGGGEELTREKVRGAIVHKASRKYLLLLNYLLAYH
jgi:hypothetical protein